MATSQLSYLDIQAHLKRTRVIAVLVIDDAKDAVPVAHALQAGGVDCLELTLRTPAALECLKQIRTEVPEMIVGAGTVLTIEQVGAVKAAGGAFGLAPGMNPRVVAEAHRIGLPFAPGVCTPTDIELALEKGCRLLKFFPSGPCGGLEYLRSIASPYCHIDLQFIPLGGVTATNAEAYLQEPTVLAIGGSWLAPRELIRLKNWESITANASEVRAAVQRLSGGKA